MGALRQQESQGNLTPPDLPRSKAERWPEYQQKPRMMEPLVTCSLLVEGISLILRETSQCTYRKCTSVVCICIYKDLDLSIYSPLTMLEDRTSNLEKTNLLKATPQRLRKPSICSRSENRAFHSEEIAAHQVFQFLRSLGKLSTDSISPLSIQVPSCFFNSLHKSSLQLSHTARATLPDYSSIYYYSKRMDAMPGSSLPQENHRLH